MDNIKLISVLDIRVANVLYLPLGESFTACEVLEVTISQFSVRLKTTIGIKSFNIKSYIMADTSRYNDEVFFTYYLNNINVNAKNTNGRIYRLGEVNKIISICKGYIEQRKLLVESSLTQGYYVELTKVCAYVTDISLKGNIKVTVKAIEGKENLLRMSNPTLHIKILGETNEDDSVNVSDVIGLYFEGL